MIDQLGHVFPAFLIRLLPLGLPLWMASCVGSVTHKQTYTQSSGPHQLHGTTLNLQVKPEAAQSGSYVLSAMVVSTASVKLDGPFRWRVVATGRTGTHEQMTVHRVTTWTKKSGRSEAFPTDKLRPHAAFRTDRNQPMVSRAVSELPGLLQVSPAKDGLLRIQVDVSIVARAKQKRQTITFLMKPTEKTEREWIFVPKEVIDHIGQPLSEADDAYWD